MNSDFLMLNSSFRYCIILLPFQPRAFFSSALPMEMILSRLDEVKSRGGKKKKHVSGAGPAPWLTGPTQDALSLQPAPRRSFLVSKSPLPGGAGWALCNVAAALARGQHVPGPRSPLAAAQPAAQILREAAAQAPGRHRDSAESLPPGPVAPPRKRDDRP